MDRVEQVGLGLAGIKLPEPRAQSSKGQPSSSPEALGQGCHEGPTALVSGFDLSGVKEGGVRDGEALGLARQQQREPKSGVRSGLVQAYNGRD